MSDYYTQGPGSTHHLVPASQPRPVSTWDLAQRADDYYDQDEERDAGFDVRADFDGTGPRWSEVHGVKPKPSDYLPVTEHVPPLAHADSTEAKDELVSVPVLGPEWKRGELHDLSKSGRAELAREKTRRAWLAWSRGERGMCGVRWLTRRVFVFLAFFIIAALIVVLYFTIPRAVSFSFYADSPFTVDNTTIVFNRSPTNFSFSANLNLLADASSSYLPVHFKQATATLFDLNTNKVIATGTYSDHSIAHKQNVPVVFPVTFSYSAINDSDTTWNDVYNACEHEWTGVTRPDLKFRLEISQSILGLASHPTTETQISNVACPFELASNSA